MGYIDQRDYRGVRILATYMSGPTNKAFASPNFAFLMQYDEVLVRHAALAERYVFDDPNSARMSHGLSVCAGPAFIGEIGHPCLWQDQHDMSSFPTPYGYLFLIGYQFFGSAIVHIS